MKVAVIHGQAHKGSTYHATHLLLTQLQCEEKDIIEYTVNGISQCVGCFQCILEDEKFCPHRIQIEPIIKSIEEADVIIMDSPNYVMGMTGQLKSFCDHLGYRWMSHRPNGEMRKKIGVAISTTAGMGAEKVTKDIATQMQWWAVGKVYKTSFVVATSSWEQVDNKHKTKVQKKVNKISKKINARYGKVKFGIKGRFFFFIMKKMQEGMGYNPVDVAWWRKNGWIK